MIEIIQKYIEKLLILISSCPIPFDDNLHKNLPTEGGIYRVFKTSSDWRESIYVGKSSNLQERIYNNLLMGNIQSHTLKHKLINAGFTNEKVKQYLKNNCRVQYLEISDERQRSFFEYFTISILKPKYNNLVIEIHSK